MRTLMTQLAKDEAGFIVSAELVLVGTIAILSMVVGLSELAMNINSELEDVGSAFGSVNQSFEYSLAHGNKGCSTGSSFEDCRDSGDSQWDISCSGNFSREN